MITVFNRLDDIEKIKDAWTDLWRDDPFSTVFNYPDWYISYAKAKQDTEPYVVACSADSKLRCIWPLEKRKNTIIFLSDPMPDYSRPAVAQDADTVEIVRTFLEHLQNENAEKIVLKEFRYDDPLPGIIRAQADDFGYKTILEQRQPCPKISRVKDPEIFRKKFADSKNQKRIVAKLRRTGDVQYKRITDRMAILPLLPEFFIMHTARWAGKGDTIFMQPWVRAFYTNLIQNLPGELIYFTTLRLNDEIIAMDLDFSHNGTLYWYKSAFDINRSGLSPGLANMCHIGMDILNKNFHTLDLTRGEENWKLRLANETVFSHNVIICRKYLSKLFYISVRKAKTTIIRDPSLRWKIKNLIALTKAGIAKYGIRGLFAHLMSKVFREMIILPRMLFFEMSREVSVEKEDRNDISIRQATVRDLFNVVDLVNAVNKADHVVMLMRRLLTGDSLYLAYLNDTMAHAAWITCKQRVYVSEIKREVTLPEGTVYIYDCYTSPNVRGQGIYPYVLKWLVRESFRKGKYSHALIACTVHNIRSQRGIEKAGFTLKRTLTKKTYTLLA